MRRIERHVPRLTSQEGATAACGWTLGDAGDRHGAFALSCAGVHEIAASTSGGCAAARQAAAAGFALRLAVRRLAALKRAVGSPRRTDPLVALCWPANLAHEIGHFQASGLAALGLDNAHLLIIETAKPAETLWAMEEVLKSGAVALTVGAVPDVGLTPARRLALAADAGGTSCLLVTGAASGGAAATVSRWRVGPALSGPDDLDDRAPGAFSVSLTVERCRQASPLPLFRPFALEWCDETHRFRVPAAVADRAADQAGPPATRRAG